MSNKQIISIFLLLIFLQAKDLMKEILGHKKVKIIQKISDKIAKRDKCCTELHLIYKGCYYCVKNKQPKDKLYVASMTKIATIYIFLNILEILKPEIAILDKLEMSIEALFPGFCEKFELGNGVGKIKILDLIDSNVNFSNYSETLNLMDKIAEMKEIFVLTEEKIHPYNDTVYHLMAKLAEYASQKPFKQLFKEILLAPNDLKGLETEDELKMPGSGLLLQNAVGAANMVVQNVPEMMRMREIIRQSRFGDIIQGSARILDCINGKNVFFARGGMIRFGELEFVKAGIPKDSYLIYMRTTELEMLIYCDSKDFNVEAQGDLAELIEMPFLIRPRLT